MDNLFLTGFMGVGKSAVSRLLNAKLKWDLIDTDRLVEKKAQKTISELFKEGEAKFREMECSVIDDIIKSEKQIISLGGGSLLSQSNRLKVLGAGKLIYLSATAETLLSRIEKESALLKRPLVDGREKSDKLETIKNLLKERENIYQMAHHTVVTDHKALEKVAQEILALLGVG